MSAQLELSKPALQAVTNNQQKRRVRSSTGKIIADNLRKIGWDFGCISSTEGRQFWVVVAEREDAGRFILQADEKLTAFVELESAIRRDRFNRETKRHREPPLT